MQLRRTSEDKVIAGVCGGIAQASGLNPKHVRIAFVVMVLFLGLSAWTYLIAWLLMPSDR